MYSDLMIFLRIQYLIKNSPKTLTSEYVICMKTILKITLGHT